MSNSHRHFRLELPGRPGHVERRLLSARARRPERLRRARLLRRALRHGRGEFHVLRTAEAGVCRAWADRTPPGFEFSVKLYQKFTHPRMFKRAASTIAGRLRHAAIGAGRAADGAGPAEPGRPRRVQARDRAARRTRASSARCSRNFRRASRNADAARDYLDSSAQRVQRLPRRGRAPARELERRVWRDARAPERASRPRGCRSTSRNSASRSGRTTCRTSGASTTCGFTGGTPISGGGTRSRRIATTTSTRPTN